MACSKLIQEGVDVDLWNLDGGIDAWKELGLPTTSDKLNSLSLERQTQLFVSIFILSGLTLKIILKNDFYLILPLVTGLGLLNAGITGWCGLTKLLSKMPWNK